MTALSCLLRLPQGGGYGKAEIRCSGVCTVPVGPLASALSRPLFLPFMCLDCVEPASSHHTTPHRALPHLVGRQGPAAAVHAQVARRPGLPRLHTPTTHRAQLSLVGPVDVDAPTFDCDTACMHACVSAALLDVQCAHTYMRPKQHAQASPCMRSAGPSWHVPGGRPPASGDFALSRRRATSAAMP